MHTEQSQKFHKVSKISTKLASLASEVTGLKFQQRYDLLLQIVSAWESDSATQLIIGEYTGQL